MTTVLEEKLIAVATANGADIDSEFGKANSFDIYRIVAGEAPKAEFFERREVSDRDERGTRISERQCSPASGCSKGGCGGGRGCAGQPSPHLQARLDAVSDCLCVLCAHAGPGAKKALAAQAVTVFDIALPVERALPKVVAWYTRSPKARCAK